MFSHCCQFFFSLLWGKRANIYTSIQRRRSGLDEFARSSVCLFFLNCIQKGWTTLLRYTGQTTLLQALTFGHMRSNDYSTNIFVNNFLLSTLSIMSINHCRPTLSGRRGRIQMRVKRMFIWTTKYTELPRAVRDGQNPLPHKWLDHHGGTSRNSGRSNEAGEAACKSEREAEPSAARPQLTRNGRCSGRSPR